MFGTRNIGLSLWQAWSVMVWVILAIVATTVVVGSGDTPETLGRVGYTLDKVGNRTARTSSVPFVPSVANTFTSRDWLTSDTYDANGNTTFSPGVTTQDVYDFEDRLIVRHRSDGTTINLSYDADGIRRQKTIFDLVAGFVSSTSYLVCTNNLTGYAQVLEERRIDAAGTTLKTYTYGSDLLSVSETSTLNFITRYYVYDGGGSVRALTDDNGAITDTWDYDAFGVLVGRTGETDNAYLYRGEQFDADLGQYYLRARFYNQATGRFWNQDTYEGRNGEPATLHKYLYTHANPVMFGDPSGHFASIAQVNMTFAVVGTLAIMAVPNMQRIIQDFGEAAVGLAGEIGESALGRAQQATGMAAATIGLAYTGLRDQIDAATRDMADAIKNQLRRLKVVPISFSMMPHIAKHIQDAEGGPLRPQLLTRTTSTLAKLNRRAAIAGRGSAGPGMSWDEYPFASTAQGGPGSSVRSVPLHENLVQGGVIGASYTLQSILPGDSFWVVVIP